MSVWSPRYNIYCDIKKKTNEDLEKMTNLGRFKVKLFYLMHFESSKLMFFTKKLK